MSTVLIAGGTGLIGTQVSKMLTERGHKVRHLSRSKKPDSPYPTFVWDLDKGEIEAEALKGCEVVINLAGAGIADERWTEERKKVIIDSRVSGNVLFAKHLPQYPSIKSYISASAIGYYGDRGSDIMTEKSGAGQEGFLPYSVLAWEKAIDKVKAKGIPTTIIRIGVVLSTKGGALQKLLLPFKFWTGVYFGDGQQYYSWIHIEDLSAIFCKAVEEAPMEGIYNGVAPHPLRNKEFTRQVGEAMDKPVLMIPSPAPAMRLAMGEMADVVLTGANISSKKIEEEGFTFKFPYLKEAVQDLLEREI